MSYDLDRKMIETAYKEEMAEGSLIQYGNSAFPKPSAAYTRITVLTGTASVAMAITAGSQRRHAGIVDVGIFVRPDAGEKGLRDIASQVEAALANRSIFSGTTRLITFGASFQPLGKVGEWYQGTVTIRFERDSNQTPSSIRTFAGRRLHTFAGARLSRFTQ